VIESCREVNFSYYFGIYLVPFRKIIQNMRQVSRWTNGDQTGHLQRSYHFIQTSVCPIIIKDKNVTVAGTRLSHIGIYVPSHNVFSYFTAIKFLRSTEVAAFYRGQHRSC
jgi:hypothetical protein